MSTTLFKNFPSAPVGFQWNLNAYHVSTAQLSQRFVTANNPVSALIRAVRKFLLLFFAWFSWLSEGVSASAKFLAILFILFYHALSKNSLISKGEDFELVSWKVLQLDVGRRPVVMWNSSLTTISWLAHLCVVWWKCYFRCVIQLHYFVRQSHRKK